jgi:predicted GNAT family acetyltransferase
MHRRYAARRDKSTAVPGVAPNALRGLDPAPPAGKHGVMELHVEHEPGRFFARVDGDVAELVYELRTGVLDVLHTYTPPALRGRDLAARLTDAAFAYARAEGLKIVPSCSYTRTYLARHPELQALAVRS